MNAQKTLSTADLESLAAQLGASADDLRRANEAIVAANSGDLPQLSIEVGPPVDVAGDTEYPFSFGIKGIVELRGSLTYSDGPCWKAMIEASTKLFGFSLGPAQRVALSCQGAENCFSYNIRIASLKLCYGIRGAKLCFYVKGEACGLGKCVSFDETLFCLKPNGKTEAVLGRALGAGQGCGCGG